MKAKVQRLRGKVIAATNNGYARTDPRYEETKLCRLSNGKFYLKVLCGPDSFIGNGKAWRVERWPVSREEARFWLYGARLRD